MEFQDEFALSPEASNPRYRECLKNHAVRLGGHALDGCRDFLPSGAEGTLDSLLCAACNCHRNFHRKELSPVGGEPLAIAYRTPAGYLHVQRPAPPSGGCGGGGGGGNLYLRDEMDHEDLVNYGMMGNGNGNGNGNGGSSSKKRFRTKFTAEDKDKMLALAEKIGWRIQKQDEEMVQQLYEETGIRRNVFKVWMHNNKHTVGKKP